LFLNNDEVVLSIIEFTYASSQHARRYANDPDLMAEVSRNKITHLKTIFSFTVNFPRQKVGASGTTSKIYSRRARYISINLFTLRVERDFCLLLYLRMRPRNEGEKNMKNVKIRPYIPFEQRMR
jgi:hypothetical protein